MRNVDGRGYETPREGQPVSLRSWGFRDVDGDGLSVAIYRKPDRLVIEIQAPMALLDLGMFGQDAERADGQSC